MLVSTCRPLFNGNRRLQRFGCFSNCIRYSSSGQTPSQGSPEWADIKKNIELYKTQPPLYTQDLRKKSIENQKDDLIQIQHMLSQLIETNKRLSKNMDQLMKKAPAQ